MTWRISPPRKAMSLPARIGTCLCARRLVRDLHGAHRREELLDQVVLLVVERRAAEMGEAQRAVDAVAAAVAILPAALARGDHALGDHVHRLLELELLPLAAAGPPVADAGPAG